ncbi:MAG: hypothetical protein HFJ45_06180 [Clostridia bacterium]|nr:hypothetical protein [Clostridia bacterium]
MQLSLRSKYRSKEILARRQKMIEKEKLHIKDKISYERLKELYNKYGEGLEEKEFAYAFLDLDEVKYNNVSNKNSQTTILSMQYVSNEELKSIRAKLIELYDLKVVSYNKAMELYEKFGKMLFFKLFSEEILGIDEKIFKSKKIKKNPDREIEVNFDSEPGEFTSLDDTIKDMPMYVLNPEYILEIRKKIIYEDGLHIKESIDYEIFKELYNKYGKDMLELVFAQEVLDIGPKSLNRMKGPKKNSTIILQNVEISKEYIDILRNKIIVLNKLEGGQVLEYSKLREFNKQYAIEFLERDFAVDILDVKNENYRPTGTNTSVTILNSKETNFEALRDKIIKEQKLHYDDMIDYNIFKKLHQKYAPNMSEVVFAEKILDIRSSNFMEVKHYNGRARILLNLKLPDKSEINDIRKKVIIENNFHINDEIDDKSAMHVRNYIEECKISFRKGELLVDDMDLLMECMLLVNCKTTEIELFTKMCISFSLYNKANTFITDMISNNKISHEEKGKLMLLRVHVNEAMKKENALEYLKKRF